MQTRLGLLSKTPVQNGLSSAVKNPVKSELFIGRREAQLGKAVGLTQFGVNHVTLEPGAVSSLRHWHEGEDEFVFALEGRLTLIDGNGGHDLAAGDFAGFPAGIANAHHLANRSGAPAAFLAVGLRKVGIETIHYPDNFADPVKVERDESGNRRG